MFEISMGEIIQQPCVVIPLRLIILIYYSVIVIHLYYFVINPINAFYASKKYRFNFPLLQNSL